ncbi:MAG: hypothetical protein LUG65_05055 [Clostridiales bacterium]|nr:hypothetical protein [Clostridiales bacterium]
MYNLVFFGALVGIVVLLAAAALSNRVTKGKFRLEVGGDYDERQQAARGVAYRNAFWTVVAYLALFQLCPAGHQLVGYRFLFPVL